MTSFCHLLCSNFEIDLWFESCSLHLLIEENARFSLFFCKLDNTILILNYRLFKPLFSAEFIKLTNLGSFLCGFMPTDKGGIDKGGIDKGGTTFFFLRENIFIDKLVLFNHPF